MYHLNVKPVTSEKKNGSKGGIAASVAYIKGIDIAEAAVAAAIVGGGETISGNITEAKLHKYSNKKGVDHHGTIAPEVAPEWVYDDTEFCNQLNQAEFKYGAKYTQDNKVRFGNNVILALQQEFSLKDSIKLVEEFIERNMVCHGLVAQYAIHEMESDNPHAHIFYTSRAVDKDGFLKSKRQQSMIIERPGYLLQLRREAANLTNQVLMRKGVSKRVTEKSFADLGIELKPTAKEGYLAKNAKQLAEARGYTVRSDKRAVNMATIEQNIALIEQQPEQFLRLMASRNERLDDGLLRAELVKYVAPLMAYDAAKYDQQHVGELVALLSSKVIDKKKELAIYEGKVAANENVDSAKLLAELNQQKVAVQRVDEMEKNRVKANRIDHSEYLRAAVKDAEHLLGEFGFKRDGSRYVSTSTVDLNGVERERKHRGKIVLNESGVLHDFVSGESKNILSYLAEKHYSSKFEMYQDLAARYSLNGGIVELHNSSQQQQVAYAASKVAEYLAIKQTKEQQQRLGQIIAEQTGLSEFKIEAISKEIYLLSEPDKLAAYLAKQGVKQELLPQQLSSSGKEELMVLLQRDSQGKIINLLSYDVKADKYQLLLSNNDDNNSDSGLFGLEQIKHHQDVILCNSVIEAKILQQSSEFSDVGVIAAINGKLNKRDLAILHHLNIRSLNILAAKDEKMQQFNNRLGIVRQLMPKTAILVTELNEADGSVISDYQLKSAQVKAAKLILSNRENIGSYYARRLRDSYHKFGFKISLKTDVIFRQRVQNIVKQLDVVEAGRLFDDLVAHGFAKREDEYLLNLTTNIKLNSRESREEIKEYSRNNSDVNEVKQQIYNKTARYLLAQAASKPDDLMTYLEQRGFKAGMNNIGYISNIGHLRQYLSHQGFNNEDISQYLPFWQDFAEQNKLIMAIRDEDGQVQGFVGRDISGLAKRKYLYTKGMKVRDNLLGIELCKLGDEVILVEGIIDAVQVNNQHLRQKALALGGVGISDQQLALLQQLKPSKIYLALDKDEAGQQSQLEVIARLNEAGFRQNLAVLNWDLRYKDIDELIAKETISSVESSISSADNIVEHYAAIITSKYGSKPLTITQQLECKEQVEKILSHLDSEQQIELMERFDEAGLSRQVAINISNQQQKQQLFKLSQEELAGFAPALKGYKQYMLKHSAAIKQELNIFSEDDVRQLARGYCGAAEQEIEQGIVDHILQQEIIARPELRQVIEQGARVITNKLSIKEALFTEQNVRAYVIELFKQLKLEGVKEEVVAEIVQQVLSHQQIVKLERLSLRGQQYYSTQSYLKREENVKQLAGKLLEQQQERKLVDYYRENILNDQQYAAYRQVIDKKGGIEIIRGIAGTGKSTLLQEFKKHKGYNCNDIHGLAVSTVVVNSLKAIGIEAKTIANIMSERSNFAEQVQANDAIIVDEAAMLDMKQMQHIMQLAFDKKCKLILVGDDGQVQPINGGQPFKLLAEQLPGNVHELKQVIRQKAGWQQHATLLMAERDFAAAIELYSQAGALNYCDSDNQAIEKLAIDYVSEVISGQVATNETIVMSYTRKDVARLNKMIRNNLKLAGRLKDEQQFTLKQELLIEDVKQQLQAKGQEKQSLLAKMGNKLFGADKKESVKDKTQIQERQITLSVGDKIICNRPDRELNIYNGLTGEITKIKNDIITINEQGTGKERQIDLGQYNYIDYGYAVTVHKWQGGSANKSYVHLNKLYNANIAYPALTRHKEDCQIYVSQQEFADNKSLAYFLSREAKQFNAADFDSSREQLLQDTKKGLYYRNVENYLFARQMADFEQVNQCAQQIYSDLANHSSYLQEAGIKISQLRQQAEIGQGMIKNSKLYQAYQDYLAADDTRKPLIADQIVRGKIIDKTLGQDIYQAIKEDAAQIAAGAVHTQHYQGRMAAIERQDQYCGVYDLTKFKARSSLISLYAEIKADYNHLQNLKAQNKQDSSKLATKASELELLNGKLNLMAENKDIEPARIAAINDKIALLKAQLTNKTVAARFADNNQQIEQYQQQLGRFANEIEFKKLTKQVELAEQQQQAYKILKDVDRVHWAKRLHQEMFSEEAKQQRSSLKGNSQEKLADIKQQAGKIDDHQLYQQLSEQQNLIQQQYRHPKPLLNQIEQGIISQPMVKPEKELSLVKNIKEGDRLDYLKKQLMVVASEYITDQAALESIKDAAAELNVEQVTARLNTVKLKGIKGLALVEKLGLSKQRQELVAKSQNIITSLKDEAKKIDNEQQRYHYHQELNQQDHQQLANYIKQNGKEFTNDHLKDKVELSEQQSEHLAIRFKTIMAIDNKYDSTQIDRYSWIYAQTDINKTAAKYIGLIEQHSPELINKAKEADNTLAQDQLNYVLHLTVGSEVNKVTNREQSYLNERTSSKKNINEAMCKLATINSRSMKLIEDGHVSGFEQAQAMVMINDYICSITNHDLIKQGSIDHLSHLLSHQEYHQYQGKDKQQRLFRDIQLTYQRSLSKIREQQRQQQTSGKDLGKQQQRAISERHQQHHQQTREGDDRHRQLHQDEHLHHMHEHEHQHGLEHLHHDPIEQAIAHHLKPSKQHLEHEHQQQLHRELSRHHGPEL